MFSRAVLVFHPLKDVLRFYKLQTTVTTEANDSWHANELDPVEYN